MNTKTRREVGGESKGIRALIARLIRRRSVVDIVERFQAQHALQEERQMKSFRSLTNGAVDPSAPNKNGIKAPLRKEPSPPHSGLIVGRLPTSG